MSEDKIKALEAENKELKAQLEEQQKLNGELNKAVEAAESAPKSQNGPFLTFKVDGKTYELIVKKSRYAGKEVNAETLKADKDLQAQLVKIKAGVIREKGGSK